MLSDISKYTVTFKNVLHLVTEYQLELEQQKKMEGAQQRSSGGVGVDSAPLSAFPQLQP